MSEIRRPKPQTMLHVLRTERLTPRLVRVWLGGPGFASFAPNGHTDMYVKLLFTPEGAVPPAPLDLAEARATLPREQVPVTRTYTVRCVRPEAQELALDFVTHGDAGLAAPWALRAQPGDRLLLQGPGGAYSPLPEADFHVIAGDESALPAIASALEALPAEAQGLAVLEAESDADRLDLTRPDGVALHWAERNGAGQDPHRLRDALAELLREDPRVRGEWPSGIVDVFAHGERESIKALRGLFREHSVPRERLSISAYWAQGRTEDAFQAEKKTPVGAID